MKILPHKNSAFSLIEVTLALGLVSFVLVALLGLMSVGMGASQQAKGNTLMGQILAQAALVKTVEVPDPNDPQAPPTINPIQQGDEVKLYYSADGVQLGSADAAAPYIATITGINPTNGIPGRNRFTLLRIEVKGLGRTVTTFSTADR